MFDADIKLQAKNKEACISRSPIVYIQAFLNFTRKSTMGFSIHTVVLDFIGGVATLTQMSVQSIDQGHL